MTRAYNFSLVKLASHPARGESLNVGLIIFSDDGLDVRLPTRLDRLKALSGAFDLEAIRSAVLRLAENDEQCLRSGETASHARLCWLRDFSPMELSELGNFVAPNRSAYEDTVNRLLRSLVEPEPAPLRHPRKRTRLLSVVKSALKLEHVLAQKGEDLSAHRVVPNLKIAEGLSADLVLKNGAYHVVETIDFSSDDVSPRRVVSEIAISALVLEQARMTFGENDTFSKIVYEASAALERIAMPSLEAAAHQGAELINWASREDQLKIIHYLSSLATPAPSKKKAGQIFNASLQHPLKLN